MAELPLQPAARARDAGPLSELEAALEACNDLLDGGVRLGEDREVPWPIQVALEHPEHGPWVRRFLAGDLKRPSRRDAVRWRVLQADLPQALRELAARTFPQLAPGEGERL